MKIGIIGYSAQKFDEDKAREIINMLYDSNKNIPNITIVSGLTNIGIPKIAYEEAVKRDWKTVGIACEKANDYEIFPVDKKIIVGDDWGDESNTFLNSIDVLVKIGGGEQSKKEFEHAKEMGLKVFEFSLESKKEEDNE
jgi:hypothetical protein